MLHLRERLLAPAPEEANAKLAWTNDRCALAPKERLEVRDVVIQLTAFVGDIIYEEVNLPVITDNAIFGAQIIVGLHRYLRC